METLNAIAAFSDSFGAPARILNTATTTATTMATTIAPAIVTTIASTGNGTQNGQSKLVNCGAAGWSADNTSQYVASVMGGAYACLAIGIIAVIVAAVWRCCPLGFCKGKTMEQVAGVVFILLGILLIALPFLASSGACGTLINDICTKKAAAGCACKAKGTDIWTKTQSEKDILMSGCNALGFLVAYIAGLGFFGCILGPISAGFGCCLACQCCGPKAGALTGVDQTGNTTGEPTTVAPKTDSNAP